MRQVKILPLVLLLFAAFPGASSSRAGPLDESPRFFESDKFLDFYAVIGVPRTATPEEITKARRKLSQSLHPDRAGESMTDRQSLVNRAYDVLSDSALRAEYDRSYSARFGKSPKSVRGDAARPFPFQDFSKATPPPRARAAAPKPPVAPAPPAKADFEQTARKLANALSLPEEQRLPEIAKLKSDMAGLSSDERSRLTSRALDYLEAERPRKAPAGPAPRAPIAPAPQTLQAERTQARSPAFEKLAAQFADILELPQTERLEAIGKLRSQMGALTPAERTDLTSRALDYLGARKAYGPDKRCSTFYAQI